MAGCRIQGRIAGIVLVMGAALLAVPASAGAQVSFGKSVLSGSSSQQPTSLQFGPDGRLYVSSQKGQIKAYTVSRNGPNSYAVTATETINHIASIGNHNDSGGSDGIGGRLVTGILVAGTPSSPVIYVTSSDPRIGAGPSGNDLNLDTNSGILTKLTKQGGGWAMQHLVLGLPRSEENHTANGMALSANGSTLYIAQGGNTNNGAPSNNFANLPEYALSAAILSVNLNAVPYTVPTLKGGTSPWGGEDGADMGKLVAGAPVQIHAPGYRNPYDLVRTVGGKLFTIDNGANSGWGAPPVNEGPGGTCTNQVSEPGTTNQDELYDVTNGHYGGHPNPTRGNASNVPGAVPAGNPVECDFRTGAAAGALASFPNSTNGLTEYTATNFGGQMTGELLTASLNGTVYRVKQSGSYSSLVSNLGVDPLDVTTVGNSGAFAGTIWVTDVASSQIHILEPTDFKGAIFSCNPGVADSDGDGYSNADEAASGTNPCSPADVPADFDGDKVGDVTDPDDDNDRIPDVRDPFAIDANNGFGTQMPVQHLWENDSPPAGGLLNLGFTGLMTNGTADYRSLFNPSAMTAGGAAGIVTIDAVPDGDAYAGMNNQQYGFQFGVNAHPGAGTFVAHTRIAGPFQGITPGANQSMGMFVGTGDQDNYVKLTTAFNGVQRLREVDGSPSTSLKSVTFPGPAYVDLFLRVDPAARTIQPSYALPNAAAVAVGQTVSVPADWFSGRCTSLAVGLISTSTGGAPPFPASWDFVQVKREDGAASPPAPAPSGCRSTVGSPPGGADGKAPRLRGVRLRPREFGAERRGAAIAKRVPKLRKILRSRRGARLDFRLSEAAKVRYQIERPRSGRRVGGTCRKPTSRNRGARECTRYKALRGAVSRSYRAGRNRARVTGRLRNRALKPGRYALALRASDRAGNRSKVRRMSFVIVRP